MSPALAGAGNGDISVVIVDPQGHQDTVELILENRGDAVFRCTYRPVMEGPHTIHVLFAGQEIPKSPFAVNIAEGEPRVSRTPATAHDGPYTRRCWVHPSVRPSVRPSSSVLIHGFNPEIKKNQATTRSVPRTVTPPCLSFLAPPVAPPTGAPLQIAPKSVRAPPGAKGGKGAPPPKPARPS